MALPVVARPHRWGSVATDTPEPIGQGPEESAPLPGVRFFFAQNAPIGYALSGILTKGITMSDSVYPCDLCRLPVETEGFELWTRAGKLRFCCEGCQGIYRMLHEDEIIDQPPSPPAA